MIDAMGEYGDCGRLYGSAAAKSCVLELVGQLRSCDDERRYPAILAQISRYCPSFADQCELLRLFEGFEFPAPAPQPPRSIAQFYYRAGNGGIERTLVALASMFDESGKDSLVITNIPRDEGSYDAADGVSWATVPEFHVGNATSGAVQGHLDGLLELLLNRKVDALVHHAWLSLQCCWDLLLCRLLGIRFVYLAHGVFSYPLTLSSPERACFALVPRIASLSSAVVCLSETNKQYFGQFNANVRFIPDPIPESARAIRTAGDAGARGAAGGGSDGRKTVLWVGRFDDQKRPVDAVQIMRRVVDAVPDARLVLVGKSEDGSYEKIIDEAVVAAGLTSAVEMQGYSKDVAAWYLEADALLFTTEVEGYGIVLIEAAAAGLPVVMYDLPYLSMAECDDWIAKAPLFDTEDAACKLKALLADDEMRDEMARAAQRYYDGLATYDFSAAWDAVLSCSPSPSSEFTLPAGQEAFWGALFDHCLQGSMAIGKLRTGDEVAAALDAQRREFEASASWRVGRAVTALPRKILGRG